MATKIIPGAYLLGKRFGRLVVTSTLPPVGKWRTTYVQCCCDCGTEKAVTASSLTSGHARSCGCLHRELSQERARRHGHKVGGTSSTEYNIWRGMVARCENPKHDAYPQYGGRGIRVCAAWRESFETFLADVGPRPSGAKTLDRIDNDGNYEPGNVRWATWKEQSRNRRSTWMITMGGETLCLADAAKRVGITSQGLAWRIRQGWPESRWSKRNP